ncbi:uncharacterized protein K452DRAFT_237282 [Aplosporella prunicola CBS 121167]|uniref:Azaphilone pigments biosynthesis cluster protein L N-terminal domain-containing protein n=1 Tax=Aplosporella prunicola CBS 121167 TaxID=1176127 RepID=A0A6A6AY78_9PEZI|nr:uncharacterized protein K452DRAFT_237282 [Aplosporella prunicola CBS 121167]KAF2136566.1 hypothetical protein K452DRAFT_237282 [Aplosporella prunicola CBS 121167]
MSDPFSVAGSAVGVISLGLTVCQGIVNYYSAFKGQDEEVSQTVDAATNLSNILKILQPRVTALKEQNQTTATQIETCIESCAGTLHKLQEVLRKCEATATSANMRDRFREYRKKALYPFRRDTIKSIKEHVTDAHANVQTALQVLGM